MPKARYTAEAEQDLEEIVDYIARHNVPAAVLWLQDLLAAQPELGQRMQTIRFGEVRRHVIGNYLIYYEPSEIGIDVVRIVHGAREQRRLT